MTERITTIQIKSDTWKILTDMKSLGDSMDDVIKRLINKFNDMNEFNNEINIIRRFNNELETKENEVKQTIMLEAY